MKHRRRRSAFPTLKMAQLGMASWQVILRRTAMMAGNTCSPAEYQRMVAEKTAAMLATGTRLATGRASMSALIAPWHSRATANAKRLRKK